MKKYQRVLCLTAVIIVSACHISHSCTAFMAAKGDKVLIARNTDSSNLEARMLVIPPAKEKFGVIFLGQQGEGGGRGSFIQVEGINDHGLWYGATGLYDGIGLPQRNDISNYYNKPILPYNLLWKAMEECTTVDEVIRLFGTYYFPGVWNGHYLFVDQAGHSVIVEFGESDVVFIRRNNDFQVMTNFPNADPSMARWYNCHRYEAAETMLNSTAEISIDSFRSICDAVHQVGAHPTSISTICDLNSKDFYIYYFHNYEEHLHFNIDEILREGEQYYHLPEYFTQTRLRYPIKEDRVNPSSVTFLWNGNANSYNFYCSVDPYFTNVEPITVTASQSLRENSRIVSAGWFGLFLIGIIGLRKKKVLAAIIGMIIVSIFLSCEIKIVDPVIKSPFSPSTIEFRQNVENLRSSMVYYWKVVAVGSEGIKNESIVQTFKTKD